MRSDGRTLAELRPINFDCGFIEHHAGSVVVSFGKTRVLTTALLTDGIPRFRKDEGKSGWLTAEYGMLPASTLTRKRRASGGRTDGRSVEIQRLIGRSLRQVINLDMLGDHTLQIDCDVLQADGGTRTAAITGSYVAVALCLKDAIAQKKLKCASLAGVLTHQIAAVSLGIKNGEILTDLCYEEDVAVDTDFNLVARSDGAIVEMQGTAEGAAMTRGEVDQLLSHGLASIETLCAKQREALA